MSASDKKRLRKEQNAAAMTEKQQKAQAEAKKLKLYTTIFAIVLAVVVVAALITVGVQNYMNSGHLERKTDAITIGDITLTNADLNFYYMDQLQQDYNNWYNEYGNNIQLMLEWLHGLNITKSLDSQTYNAETGETFADHYTELAITNANKIYSLYNDAMANGFTITDEITAQVDTAVNNMEAYAASNNLKNADEYVQLVYGKGATVESYRNYVTVNAVAQAYAASIFDSFEFDKDAINAHSDEHYDEYSSFDYIVFHVQATDFLECQDENPSTHAHTEEELSAALKAAEEAAKQVVASKASDSVSLDKAISKLEPYKDTTGVKGALREGYSTTNMNEAQAKWLADPARKVGDLGMVLNEATTVDAEGNKTTTAKGYYVLLFQGREDNEINLVNAHHILVAFEGGTVDSDGNVSYSDSAKRAAKAEIENLEKQWKDNGGTKEAFIALVAENTDDTASAENGGLYENIYPGQMVASFDEFCFADGRKEGDSAIVEAEHGYHLIYFAGQQDTTYRQLLVEADLRSNAYDAWYADLQENSNYKILNTKYLARDLVLAYSAM